MANYKVIGGDLKQYGPVSAEDLCKWIADGRLNAMSLVQAHGDIEWKPLSSFPEFAEVLAGKPATLSAPQPFGAPDAGADGERQTALRRVKAPSVALMVVAILNIVLATWGLLQTVFFRPTEEQINAELQPLKQLNNPEFQQTVERVIHIFYGPFGTTFGIINGLFGLTVSVLILLGAIRMQSLRSHEMAFTAAVLAVIPGLTPCCDYLIGLVFGIWALAVLRRPDVKSQFH
jgi:GYF domain 2